VLRQNIMAAGECGRRVSLPHIEQEAESEEETGVQYSLHSHTLSDLLPPAKPLKILPPN
jgi:hypothetical protein